MTAVQGEDVARPLPPRALYIHFPLCLSICPYCDFVVMAGQAARGPDNRIAAFVEALEGEIRLRAEAARRSFGELAPLAGVYLGGGTPSLMSAAQVARLLAATEAGFGIEANAEITLEANPGHADRGDLPGFRAAGVNRLSIGAQSMQPAELRRLGRRHSPADVVDAVRLARRSGFDNVSVDLIYDVPGQTIDSWRSTLGEVLALTPDHVSAYALALDDPDAEGLTGALGDHLPARPGARRWRARAAAEQDQDRAADMYLLADELLGAAGFEWYEISNWARPGRESRHNLTYWLGDAWEAVGPGAHAFDGAGTRRWNAARLDGYMTAVGHGELPPGGAETVDPATAQADAAILRLRTRAGLTRRQLDRLGIGEAIGWGTERQLVTDAEDRFTLTVAGRLLSNELFARIVA